MYLVEIAQTNYNLAILYQERTPNREKSIRCALEVVIILVPLADIAIYTKQYLENALGILREWGLSEDEISLMIKEKL